MNPYSKEMLTTAAVYSMRGYLIGQGDAVESLALMKQFINYIAENKLFEYRSYIAFTVLSTLSDSPFTTEIYECIKILREDEELQFDDVKKIILDNHCENLAQILLLCILEINEKGKEHF